LTKCARVWAIAQLPGPHPSDRSAVVADGLALYRRTYRISPNEDQGYFISIQAPEGLRCDIMRRVETELLKLPETRATLRLVALILMVVLLATKA